MSVDFRNIRSIRGSANNGFEELCCQLARCEPAPSGSRFVRNGTPDGGVEAYWLFPDRTERGWQAKYFDRLESSQWQQLDKSVEDALTSHPNLRHYTICLPFDLPDGRREDAVSLRTKWDERVRKWESLAKAKRMAVLFDLWGASELIATLSLEQHAGRRFFWFTEIELSREWFSARLEETIAAAGPRYSLELNVELQVAHAFDALGCSPLFRQRLNDARQRYRKKLRDAVDSLRDIPQNLDATAKETFERSGSALADELDLPFDMLPSPGFPQTARSAAVRADEATELVFSQLRPLASSSSGGAMAGDPYDNRQPFQHRAYALDNFLTAVRDVEAFLDNSFTELAGRPAILLSGDAGTGKTHLFCDVARARIEAGHPTIVVLGQRFGAGSVWSQLLGALGLTCSREELLGALEACAELSGGRALLLFDAINEASEINWLVELPAMLSVVNRYPRIGIAVSCRTTYETQLVLNQAYSVRRCWGRDLRSGVGPRRGAVGCGWLGLWGGGEVPFGVGR